MFGIGWFVESILGSGWMMIRIGSWVPTEARIQLSNDSNYLHLIVEGQLYSLKKELLLELILGKKESLRLFRWMLH